MALFKHSSTPVPDGAVRVVLTGDNATLAMTCGALRRHGNLYKGNSNSYPKSAKLQPEAFASPAGCAAEIGVAQHLGQCWNARAWPAQRHNALKTMPDVGHNIEVKRIRDDKQYVEVKRKETSAETNQKRILWVVRTIGDEHIEVDLLGWIDCDYAWEHGKPTVRYGGKVDPDSHTIPLSILNKCTCLTGGTKHAPEPALELGGDFMLPKRPLNRAGAGDPTCISNQSPAAVRAMFAAANTNNPTMSQPQPPSQRVSASR